MAHTAIANQSTGRSSRARRLRFTAGALLATALVALGASSAVAKAPTPGQMSIAFPTRTASVAGPGALVSVKCTGTADLECAGTLTVEGLSEDHSVSYAVSGGEERSLVVPLGSERRFFSGIASPKMRVVAETMQPTGTLLRTARVLRFN
ncbi:MAG: hypothetical protein H0X42_03175 [Solirubrobacterales bacterium]|nr:hypothetical protein [Solirubrobacterales bacterium]